MQSLAISFLLRQAENRAAVSLTSVLLCTRGHAAEDGRVVEVQNIMLEECVLS